MAKAIQTLYKYGRINEYSESIFSTSSIWFSSPAQLNDPFECQPWFTFDGDRDQIIEVLTRVIKNTVPEITDQNAKANAVSIYLEGRHQNPETWNQLRQDLMRMLSRNIGLYCLSADNSNILLWSHYADNHRGYCIGFEATDETPVFGAAQQVNYQEEFPTVDFFNTPHDRQVDLIFLTKYQDWRYEKEWRIINHDNGPGTQNYPPELLRTITFGLRMSEQDEVSIRDWVRARGHEVEFYKATRDEKAFKLNLVKLD